MPTEPTIADRLLSPSNIPPVDVRVGTVKAPFSVPPVRGRYLPNSVLVSVFVYASSIP